MSYSATKYEIMFVDITAKPIEVMKAGKRFNLYINLICTICNNVIKACFQG